MLNFSSTIYDRNIELGCMADEACYSKFHFIRLFRNVYGQTPHQYLKLLRIQKAMQLLSSGISVPDACYEVGFESVSSFSSLFKRISGVSPSVYLSQHQVKRKQIFDCPLHFIPGCFAVKKNWTKKSNFGEAQ